MGGAARVVVVDRVSGQVVDWSGDLEADLAPWFPRPTRWARTWMAQVQAELEAGELVRADRRADQLRVYVGLSSRPVSASAAPTPCPACLGSRTHRLPLNGPWDGGTWGYPCPRCAGDDDGGAR